MTPHDSSGRATPRRRQALSLPKRRHHLSIVLILLIILISAPMVWGYFFGSEDAAVPKGSVIVETVEDGDRASGLSALDLESEALPDLLAGTVPAGENPTESLNSLSSETAPAEPRRNNAPKTILLPKAQPLAPLDPSLRRQSPFGPLPGPNASGRTPLEAYRAPAPALVGKKPVAVVLGGLGVNGPLTQRAIDTLPPEVTLSFAAHAPDLQNWINKAREAGHETLLEIPMEGTDFNPSDPGASRALRRSLSQDNNIRNLQSLLARAEGYAGLINYNGQAILTRTDITALILSETNASGLAFFFDGSFSAPSLGTLSSSLSLPYAAGNGLIDPTPEPAQIQAELDKLALSAKSEGGAFGVGFAYPETLEAIIVWTTTLANDDLALVPATAILQ